MGCDILVAVDVEADPEKVFEALSTQKGLASFWTRQSKAEPKVGSVATFQFPTAPVPCKLRIDALEKGKRVAWTCEGDFPNWKGTTVTWDLGESPNAQTRVMFRHGGWPEWYPDEEFASVNFVWAQVLGHLKGYVESGDPQPFFP
jgi:uncharacterized protein YndB with AHSA1/START domain